MATKIEWCDETINPIRTADGGYHCTKVSEGCQHCYAERFNNRFGNKNPFDNSPAEFVLDMKQLNKPVHWKKPRRIFVQSVGDIFHPAVPDSFIRKIMWHVWYNRQHTFLFLTKRPERVAGMGQCSNCGFLAPIGDEEKCSNCGVTERHMRESGFGDWVRSWPNNLWLGVTAENQARADERIPILLDIPAAVRFVSVEPMLGPMDLYKYLSPVCRQCNGSMSVPSEFGGGKPCPRCIEDQGTDPDRLNQIICGGETGPGARPLHPDWVRSLRDQCQAAGTPFIFKSWGDWMPDGGVTPYDRCKAILWNDNTVSWKVGKKNAGRLLDGQEWNQFPGVNR